LEKKEGKYTSMEELDVMLGKHKHGDASSGSRDRKTTVLA
jgi:hypothetical protein